LKVDALPSWGAALLRPTGLIMPDEMGNSPAVAVNPFTGADVATLLAERGWAVGELSTEHITWCERAAAILGVHAADRDALAEMLGLVFHYDSREILGRVESHACCRVMGHGCFAAACAAFVGGQRAEFRSIQGDYYFAQGEFRYAGAGIVHPIRLALAGRAGGANWIA